MGSTPGSTVRIGRARLTLDHIDSLSRAGTQLDVVEEAWPLVDSSRKMVLQALSGGENVYGVTTGFGALSDRRIPADSARQLQINLLRSHASGTGPPLTGSVVRTMLALRAHALALGYSGVRRHVIERLVELYNHGILPVVPSQGSVGASGDLAPLAHLSLPLAGEGHVSLSGDVMEASLALENAGLSPLQLEPKEALALINGTQAMTAIGALAQLRANRLLHAAVGSGALSVVALSGRVSSFHELIQQARPHTGQTTVAGQLRRLLHGWQPSSGHGRPVQDRYSLRALPQVLGAVLDTLGFADRVFEVEINSATDNPLLFPEADAIINGANFHGHPIALACDHVKTAIASLTTFSERRIASLVDPRASGLPAFLASEPGLNSGLMIPHYLAASIVSENRVLAHPASVDSLSTSADVEDYNSMGTLAARNLSSVVDNAARVVAIELLCAAQAIDLQQVDFGDAPVRAIYDQVRQKAPFLERDRSDVGDWIQTLADSICSGEFVIREKSPDDAVAQ